MMITRTRTRTRTTNYASACFLTLTPMLLMLMLLVSVDFSYGWVPPSSSKSSRSSSSSTSSSGGRHGNTAKFFKSSNVLTEDSSAAQSVFPEVKSPPSSTIESTTTTTTKTCLSTISKLPWMMEGDNSNNDDNVYLSHWNWQLSYFQEHLTNLRVNDNRDKDSDDISDLYYVKKDGDGDDDKSQQEQKRVYTISLESDEYRDIRMTYMHFPGAQCFRCLSYPQNGDLPIMGMGLMKFGIGGAGAGAGAGAGTTAATNMAFMDYQPLPACTNMDDDHSHKHKLAAINDLYTSELLKLRSKIPSMSQPMSHRHFDSKEERKYFTEFPLIGRWSDDDGNDNGDDDNDGNTNNEKNISAEQHRSDLERAQREYIQTHIRLTQQFGNSVNDVDGGGNESESELECNKQQQQQHVLKLHSDFDTHVSEKEPAGRFLCSAFGAEVGNKLVHNVIFPLSRGGEQQQQTTTSE